MIIFLTFLDKSNYYNNKHMTVMFTDSLTNMFCSGMACITFLLSFVVLTIVLLLKKWLFFY